MRTARCCSVLDTCFAICISGALALSVALCDLTTESG